MIDSDIKITFEFDPKIPPVLRRMQNTLRDFQRGVKTDFSEGMAYHKEQDFEKYLYSTKSLQKRWLKEMQSK